YEFQPAERFLFEHELGVAQLALWNASLVRHDSDGHVAALAPACQESRSCASRAAAQSVRASDESDWSWWGGAGEGGAAAVRGARQRETRVARAIVRVSDARRRAASCALVRPRAAGTTKREGPTTDSAVKRY